MAALVPSPHSFVWAGLSIQNLIAALEAKEQESKEGCSFLDDTLSDCADASCTHNLLSSLRGDWDRAVTSKGLAYRS